MMIANRPADPAPVSVAEGVPAFLEDWHAEHAILDPGHRAEAGRWITAIVARMTLNPCCAQVATTSLWTSFRDHYDLLCRPPLAQRPQEAFARAMCRL